MRRTLLTAIAVGAALIGLVLTSCTETRLEPQEAATIAGARGASQIFDPDVIQSVTGNGHLVGDPPERTVRFEIHRFDDGSVEGWYQASTRGPGGAQIRVRMECLHVVGNQAWVGGTIVAAVDPNNIGRPVSMRFIDNGEGANAAPDEIGGIWADYDCVTEPDHATRQLTIGNLQIRD